MLCTKLHFNNTQILYLNFNQSAYFHNHNHNILYLHFKQFSYFVLILPSDNVYLKLINTIWKYLQCIAMMGIEKIMMRKEDADEDDYVGYEADDEGNK